MKGRPDCHFSFSGLKTALRTRVREVGEDELSKETVQDLCASFQEAVADVIADRCRRAARVFHERHPKGRHLVVAGGVAANLTLRAALDDAAQDSGLDLVAPPPKLCTDNGAMIAWAGIERLKLGLTSDMEFAPRPRWPLDPDAPPATGAGVKA